MGWFSNKEKEKAQKAKADLTWTPRQSEFEQQSMTCPDPHLESFILEVRDFIPEEYHNRVFLAGGFAACFLGLSGEFGDIDIFCDSKETFNKLLPLLRKDSENEGTVELVDRPEYGRLWKFKRGSQKFDLVEVSPMMTGNVAGATKIGRLVAILASFDINWSMVGVTLDDQQVWAHPQVFQPYVRVCSDNIKHIDATQRRIKKYAERIDNANVPLAIKAIAELTGISSPEKSKDVYPSGSKYWNS